MTTYHDDVLFDRDLGKEKYFFVLYIIFWERMGRQTRSFLCTHYSDCQPVLNVLQTESTPKALKQLNSTL